MARLPTNCRADDASAHRVWLAGVVCVGALAMVTAGALASVSANSPPKFPRNFKYVVKTSYEYDPAGRLFGGVTTITIKTPPKDADRDRLSYKWTAASVFQEGYRRVNRIRGRGLRAHWTRDLDLGELAAGVVTVTVRDGRGGKAIRSFKFARGAG